MIENNQHHCAGAEEDGESVEVIVCDHRGLCVFSSDLLVIEGITMTRNAVGRLGQGG